MVGLMEKIPGELLLAFQTFLRKRPFEMSALLISYSCLDFHLPTSITQAKGQLQINKYLRQLMQYVQLVVFPSTELRNEFEF